MATAGRLKYRGFQPDPFVGRLFFCGLNSLGAGGLGDTVNRNSPVQVGSIGDWKLGAAGFFSSGALRSGRFYNWGYPSLPSYDYRSSPVAVGSDVDWKVLSFGGYSYTEETSTDYFLTHAGIRSGMLFTWGDNAYGQLGLGHRATVLSPTQVGSETDWTHICCAYKSVLGIRGGRLFAWGANEYGLCGVPSTTTSAFSSPVQIGAFTDWTYISAGMGGAHAIREGKLYGWGFNGMGEIGIGTNDVNDHSTPIQVGTFDDWIMVSHGPNLSCAGIRKPGRLFTWGHNYNGALGLGNTVSRSSPVQVGAAIDWSMVSVGNSFMAGLRSGARYGWGDNLYGQLGTGTQGNYYLSPVQIGSNVDWLDIRNGMNHSLAIRHT